MALPVHLESKVEACPGDSVILDREISGDNSSFPSKTGLSGSSLKSSPRILVHFRHRSLVITDGYGRFPARLDWGGVEPWRI